MKKNRSLRLSLLLIPLLFTNNLAVANTGPTYISGSANPTSINAGESIHFETAWNDSDGDEIFAVRVKYCQQGSSLCVTEFLDPIENTSPTRFERYIPINNGGTYEYQFIALDRMQQPSDSDDPLHSDEELGWHGNGSFTVVGNVSQKTITSTAKLKMSSTQNGVSLSVDAGRFPLINLGLDCSGTPLLNEQEVSIFEDDRKQNIFDFIAPSGGSGRIADIVFVHDDSGSLGDEAAQVKANIQKFLGDLAAQNIDFRVSLVPYGGDGISSSFSPPQGKILHNGILHDNATDFINDVNGMRFDGSTERAFAAMKLAVTKTVWRTTTHKILILVTDEPDDYQIGDPSESELIQLLKDQNVTMYGLTAGDYEFTRIATATGGQNFNITDPFSSILNDIGQQVSSRYLIQYVTDNPALDGKNRVVKLNSRLCDATGNYTPNYQINIDLMPDTINVMDQEQSTNVPVTIRVKIPSQGSIAQIIATLFYLNNTLGMYQNLPMTHIGNDIYEAIIPASSIIGPFIYFYISVTDGTMTRTFPSLDPNHNPFSITVLPNKRPVITHTPVTSATIGQPIDIHAQVTDDSNKISVIRLYYRKKGQLVYQFVEIKPDNTAESFSATIPDSFVTQNGVEYYLYAKDDLGAITTVGMLDSPFAINTVANTPPVGPVAANPIIDGNPSIYEMNGTIHIVARDTNGHLREWWGTPESGWHLEDLSAIFNGEKIAGNPIGIGVNGVQHIFARDTNEHLREWWWISEDGWHLEDLTYAGETIVGDPFYYYNGKGVQYVFAQDSDGDLRIWWWVAQDGWKSIDLTNAVDFLTDFKGLNQNIEGHLAGNPFLSIDANGAIHIFGRNSNDHLIELWWTPQDGLHIEDLTAIVGGQTIVGDPAIPLHYKDSVFARSPNGHLLEWQWQANQGWKLEDLHTNTGETISGDPKTCDDGKNIFVRDANGHLKFWENSSNQWQITDLTTVNGGKTISGDPMANCSSANQKDIVARNSDGYLHHWSFRGSNWQATEFNANPVANEPANPVENGLGYCGLAEWVDHEVLVGKGFCNTYGENITSKLLEEANSKSSCGGYYKTYGYYDSSDQLVGVTISNGNCEADREIFRIDPPEPIDKHCKKYGGTGNYRWMYYWEIQPFGGYGTLGVNCEM